MLGKVQQVDAQRAATAIAALASLPGRGHVHTVQALFDELGLADARVVLVPFDRWSAVTASTRSGCGPPPGRRTCGWRPSSPSRCRTSSSPGSGPADEPADEHAADEHAADEHAAACAPPRSRPRRTPRSTSWRRTPCAAGSCTRRFCAARVRPGALSPTTSMPERVNSSRIPALIAGSLNNKKTRIGSPASRVGGTAEAAPPILSGVDVQRPVGADGCDHLVDDRGVRWGDHGPAEVGVSGGASIRTPLTGPTTLTRSRRQAR
jgi:hypothetical protein